jgi:tRNA pseudouridine55 synthase
MDDGRSTAIPDGYLNVLKPPGMTSHDVVSRVRRVSHERRVGHAGTLDPEAAGVLPVAVGRRATRTVSSAVWDRKTYAADVWFGHSTSTDDATGEPLEYGDPSSLSGEAIKLGLNRFVGTIEQRPPSVSAVHIDGVRSYRRARQGRPELPPARVVQVEAIHVINWSSPRLTLLVQCRSGTYIRSIARDLGIAVGCPAHLASLLRLRVGPFGLDDAVSPETLAQLAESDAWQTQLWPIDVIASDLPALVVAPERLEDFAHGRGWTDEAPAAVAMAARVYTMSGDLLGFAERGADMWMPVRTPGGEG